MQQDKSEAALTKIEEKLRKITEPNSEGRESVTQEEWDELTLLAKELGYKLKMNNLTGHKNDSFSPVDIKTGKEYDKFSGFTFENDQVKTNPKLQKR